MMRDGWLVTLILGALAIVVHGMWLLSTSYDCTGKEEQVTTHMNSCTADTKGQHQYCAKVVKQLYCSAIPKLTINSKEYNE